MICIQFCVATNELMKIIVINLLSRLIKITCVVEIAVFTFSTSPVCECERMNK